MKIKNLLIVALLSIVSVVNAQNDTLYLYKNGAGTLVSAVSGIDSMVVRRPTSTDTLYFYRNGILFQKNATADIDSLSFKKPTVIQILDGQNYKGGIVAYILKEGDLGYVPGETHGFITTNNDLSTSSTWYNYCCLDDDFMYKAATLQTYAGTSLYTNQAGAIGKGKGNTENIVAKFGDGNYAAKICYDLVVGENSDWYLPSSSELAILISKGFIPRGDEYSYWSSTEEEADKPGYAIYFNNGWYMPGLYPYIKVATMRVRAISYF